MQSIPPVKTIARRLAATYFSLDPRSLGLFRIALGVVLLIDLWQRYGLVDPFYTDQGLFPSETLRGLRNPPILSIFLYVSTREGAVALMGLCAVAYVCLTIGLATRVAHALALVAVVSLNSRIFPIESGGNHVLNLLTVWTLFLPLGRRFSVDALLRRRFSRNPARPPDVSPVWSLAVLALLLQFAAIYFFNVIQKTGTRWGNGSAVYYTLHDELMVTAIGVWIRENVPYAVLKALSHSTLWVESAAVLLILCPIFARHARLAAVILMPALHLGFGACLEIGIFSYAVVGFYPLLLAPSHWQWMERRWSEWRPGAGAAAVETGPANSGSGWNRVRAVFRVVLAVPREAVVILLMAAAFGDIVACNPAVPPEWRYRQPELLSKIIWYPRIRQCWRMYAPDPMFITHALAVEARTFDGRVVDPFNEVASRYRTLPESGPMPVRLGQVQQFNYYSLHLQPWMKPALRDWIMRYPKRTGRPGDRIVGFQLYTIMAKIPPPGSDLEKTMIRKRSMAYP